MPTPHQMQRDERAWRRLWIFSVAWLSFSVIGIVLAAFKNAIYFEAYAADGAFQLLNPMRRLAAGQIAGRDFQFFHGIGVVFLHYPFYRLLGSTIFASELTRWLLSGLSFAFLNIFFLRAYGVRKELAYFWGAFMVAGASYLRIEYLMFPGNSLIGIRAFLPLALAAGALLWLRNERHWATAQKYFLLEIYFGATLALALFFGTDQGLPASAAMIAVLFLCPPWPGRAGLLARVRSSAICVASLLTVLFLVYFLTAGRSWLEPLKFAVVTVPRDQFWYFGGPPYKFIAKFSDFLPDWVLLFRAAIFILLFPFCIYRYFRTQGRERLKSFIAIFVLLYGLGASAGYLGYPSSAYTSPLFRAQLLVIFWLIYEYSDWWMRLRLSWKGVALAVLPLLYAHLIFIRTCEIASYHVYRNMRLAIAGPFLDPSTLHEVAAGTLVAKMFHKISPHFYVNQDWEVHLNRAHALFGEPSERSAPLSIWSTYTSMIENDYKVFPPSCDYIIHCLGPDARADYVQKFRESRPLYATSMRRKYFDWEVWLQNTHWDYYETLLAHYAPVSHSRSTIFWRREGDEQSSAGAVRSNWDWSAAPSGDRVILPIDDKWWKRGDSRAKDSEKMILIEVEYSIDNPWKRLPIFGGLPRFIIETYNAQDTLDVSVAPYRDRIQFPVHLKANTRPFLEFKTKSLLPGARFDVKQVRVRALDISQAKIAALVDIYPF